MKKFLSLMILFSIMANTGATVAEASGNTEFYSGNDVVVGGIEVFRSNMEEDQISYHEVYVEDEVYYCSEVLSLTENIDYVICFCEEMYTVLYVDSQNNQVIIENTVESGITTTETINIPNSNNSGVTPYAIGGQEESWWGLEYYYNTSAAQGDVYWRLYNPLDEDEPSNFFFAEKGTTTQDDAEGFASCVNEMVGIQEAMDIAAGAEIPGVLLALGSAPSLTSIIAALAEAALDTVSPGSVADLYDAKDRAIDYYNDLK